MKRLVLLLLSLVLSLAFAQQQVEGLDVTPGESAAVRIAHLAVGVDNVDVYVNDTSLLSGAAFRDVSQYHMVPAGSLDIRITAGGQEDALIEASLDVEEGVYYTIAALGSGENLEARVYRDNLRAFPPANGASVRILHAAQGAGAVDVVARDGDMLVEGLDFAQVSEYFFVPADTYNLDIRAAGSEDAAFSADGLEFQVGHIYTVFAIGTQEVAVQEEAQEEATADQQQAEPTEEAAATEAETETETAEETEAEGTEAAEEPEAQPADEEAGTGTLEITVEQEGVTVLITGPDGYQQSITGSQTLTGLQPGSYILMASAEGYEPVQEEVELEEGGTQTVTLELQEAEEGAEQETQQETEQQETEQEATEQQTQQQQTQQQGSTETVSAAGLELVVVVDARIVSEAQDTGAAAAQPTAPAEEPAATEEEPAEEPTTEEEEVTEAEEPETEEPEAEEEPTETEEPATEEETTETEEPEAEPADEEAGTGTLEITLGQEGVTVVITGPDGYQESVTGSQTLTGLQPGRYILIATGDGYQATEEEIELEEGGTQTVTLELEEEE